MRVVFYFRFVVIEFLGGLLRGGLVGNILGVDVMGEGSSVLNWLRVLVRWRLVLVIVFEVL